MRCSVENAAVETMFSLWKRGKYNINRVKNLIYLCLFCNAKYTQQTNKESQDIFARGQNK